MSNEADIQAERSLDESVGELLTQLEAEAAQDDGALGEEAEALPPAAASGDAEAAGSEPDGENEVTERPEEEGMQAKEAPAGEVHGEKEPGGEEASAEAREGEESFASLDEQLAGVADDLIEEGNAEAEQSVRAPFMPAVAALQPEVYGPKPVEPEEAASEDEAEGAAPAPVVAEARPRLRWNVDVREVVEAWAYALLGRISAPIQGQPAQVRSAVGWLAVFNLFLATCVWGYVLFVRSDEPPPPRGTASATHVADVVAPEGLR